MRRTLDNVERLIAKKGDNATRRRRADAVDDPRREKALDPGDCRRSRELNMRRLKLLPKTRVLNPLAPQQNLLPNARRGGGDGRRYQRAFSLGAHAEHGEAPVAAFKNHAFYRPRQIFHAHSPFLSFAAYISPVSAPHFS